MHIREFNVRGSTDKVAPKGNSQQRNLPHLQLALSRLQDCVAFAFNSVYYKYKFSLKDFENISRCFNNGKVHLFLKNPLQEKYFFTFIRYIYFLFLMHLNSISTHWYNSFVRNSQRHSFFTH